jgi:ABC-type antimicrobial peptide transport system permease subunit
VGIGGIFQSIAFHRGRLACNFLVSIVIAIPTLLRTLFSNEVNQRFFESAAVTLIVFGHSIAITSIIATEMTILADHIDEATAQSIAVSAVLLESE